MGLVMVYNHENIPSRKALPAFDSRQTNALFLQIGVRVSKRKESFRAEMSLAELPRLPDIDGSPRLRSRLAPTTSP